MVLIVRDTYKITNLIYKTRLITEPGFVLIKGIDFYFTLNPS